MLKEWKKLKVFLSSILFFSEKRKTFLCMEKKNFFPYRGKKGEKLQNKIEFNKFNIKRTSKSCSVTFLV